MKIDTPGAKFRKLLHALHWIESWAHKVAKGVPPLITYSPEAKGKFILFPGLVLIAG
jgi:hypothetical protein